MAKHLAPAAVIIGAHLARADGTPLRHALASHESTAELPLVLLISDESDRAALEPTGERLVRVLSKPVGPTELLKALGEMLTPHAAVTARSSADVVFKRFAV
jgi:CheY-like chemotaxis protein